MDKFAFIGHPTDFQNLQLLLGRWKFLTRILSQSRLKQVIVNFPPYKLFYVNSIKSLTEKEISGYSIICPFFPEQMVSFKKEIILKKIIDAVKLAEKFGVRIVGLGGFTSIVTNGGKDLLNKVSVPVTSGNTYTAYLAIEGLCEAVNVLGLNLNESTLAIVGATGDIGSICAKFFVNKVKRLILVARDQARLDNFQTILKKENEFSSIEAARSITNIVSSVDIILTATSALTTLIEPERLKPGAIICDVSIPSNVAKNIMFKRKDVLVFEGGLAKLPYSVRIKNKIWKKLFPEQVIFGCLAETILLTLEGRFVNFSIGRGNISLEKISKIGKISQHHGFKLAPFFCSKNVYTEKDIEKLKNIIHAKL